MPDFKKELPQTTQSSSEKEQYAQAEQDKTLSRKEDVSFRDMFNRFLEEDFFLEPFDFTRSSRLASLFNRQFLPRVDVSETDTHVKVIADLPGVNPDDLDIEVESNRMSIRGKTQRESLPDERPYRYERTYGEFRREFVLPSEVDKEGVRAVYKDGILTVSLPKTESSRRGKIQIERQ